MLKPNGYVFNYVILTTTLLIIIQCETSLTRIGYEQVLLIPLCLIGFFLHQCIIHGPPCVNLVCLLSSMGTSHLTIGNIITPFLGLFQYHLCGLLWASLLQYTIPTPTTKGACIAPFAKKFQVHTPRSGMKLRKVCPTPP